MLTRNCQRSGDVLVLQQPVGAPWALFILAHSSTSNMMSLLEGTVLQSKLSPLAWYGKPWYPLPSDSVFQVTEQELASHAASALAFFLLSIESAHPKQGSTVAKNLNRLVIFFIFIFFYFFIFIFRLRAFSQQTMCAEISRGPIDGSGWSQFDWERPVLSMNALLMSRQMWGDLTVFKSLYLVGRS